MFAILLRLLAIDSLSGLSLYTGDLSRSPGICGVPRYTTKGASRCSWPWQCDQFDLINQPMGILGDYAVQGFDTETLAEVTHSIPASPIKQKHIDARRGLALKLHLRSKVLLVLMTLSFIETAQDLRSAIQNIRSARSLHRLILWSPFL